MSTLKRRAAAFAVIAASLTIAPAAAEAGTEAEKQLSIRLYRQLQDPRFAGCHVGLAVYSLDRGTWLYDQSADRRFVPASNVKLITGALALWAMGADYRADTWVRFDGQRQGGDWNGTLTLVGGGDPLLNSGDIDDLVGQLKASGLQHFTGRVQADDSRFDTERRGQGWMWDDIGTDDGPPVTALTLDLGHLGLMIRPAALGQPLQVQSETAYGELDNRTMTDLTRRPLETDDRTEGGRPIIRVRGALAPGSAPVRTDVTVGEPALLAAARLAGALARQGVASGIPVAGAVPPITGEMVARHGSPDLATAVRAMQKDSVNLIAEILLKQAGAVKGGLPGSTAKGLAAAQPMLAAAGWAPGTYRLVDGSGLSRYNLVSPRQFVQLLTFMDRQPAAAAFRQALPIAGVDGTLANRFHGLRDSRRVIAKTGTLSGACALSGYVETAGQEHLAFSLLVNGGIGPAAPIRAAQDSVIAALADWRR